MATCSKKGSELQEEEKEKESEASASSVNEQALNGTTWNVRAMGGQEKEELQPLEKDYGLRFPNDSSFRLKLDVNHCQASYKIPKKGRISFQTPSCTEKCCDPEEAKELARALPKMDRYEVEGDELLLTGNGKRIEAARTELEEY